MLPLLRCFFAHLLILQYPDHHQNLISSYLYYSGPVHKISSQSFHNFLSNVVHRQTNRQTDRQTNATKNITSFAKEVKIPSELAGGLFQFQSHPNPTQRKNLLISYDRIKVHQHYYFFAVIQAFSINAYSLKHIFQSFGHSSGRPTPIKLNINLGFYELTERHFIVAIASLYLLLVNHDKITTISCYCWMGFILALVLRRYFII